jgi:hypothetical protein
MLDDTGAEVGAIVGRDTEGDKSEEGDEVNADTEVEAEVGKVGEGVTIVVAEGRGTTTGEEEDEPLAKEEEEAAKEYGWCSGRMVEDG